MSTAAHRGRALRRRLSAGFVTCPSRWPRRHAAVKSAGLASITSLPSSTTRRIDLLTRIDGVEFDACWHRRETIQLDGRHVHFIGLEDFKADKRAVGRPKNLADLDALEPPKAD